MTPIEPTPPARSPPRFRFSMRFSLVASIGLMGVLGLLLALAAGEIYQNQALDNQRLALKEMVELNATEQLRELDGRSRDLALAIQSEPGFRRAWNSDTPGLAQELNRQLRQYAVTVKQIRVERLTVYDGSLRKMAAATLAAALPARAAAACPALLEQVRRAAGDAWPPLKALCRHGGRVRYAVLVPFGDHKRRGALEVITDPVPSLARLEDRLGIPVRVGDAGDRQLFASVSWPSPDGMNNALVAEQSLATPDGQPALKVAVMRNIEDLQDRLRETRYLVMTVAVGVTFLGMLLAVSFLEKTTLRPLGRLTQHLRGVSHDTNRLAEPVNVSGVAEVRDLAEDFNRMAQELSRLYGSLEHMAFTDPLTNLPNRARFRDSLDEAARQHAHAQTPFALLLMDLDRFKGVNDTLGHQTGDLLLQEVSQRLRSVLRGSDTITRLDNETILTLDSKMVARLGGDEFAAILPRVGILDDAGAIARKLLQVMQDPFIIRNHRLSIGISIGIALFPHHGGDIDALIQRADAAMYYAKNNHTGYAFPETMKQKTLL